jgi:hypothetical protein
MDRRNMYLGNKCNKEGCELVKLCTQRHAAQIGVCSKGDHLVVMCLPTTTTFHMLLI